MQKVQSTLIVPPTVRRLTEATAVLHDMRPTKLVGGNWMCKYVEMSEGVLPYNQPVD